MIDVDPATGVPPTFLHVGNRRWDYLAIFSVTLTAWAPMWSRYIPIADDIPLAHALDRGLVSYFVHLPRGSLGIWRGLGIIFMSLGARHPLLYGPVITTLHGMVTCLFLVVCRTMLGGRWLPLTLALIFGAFPFAGGALVWAAAGNLVVLEALFLITLLLFCRLGFDQRWQGSCFVASFVLTVAAQLVQENLLFAFAASGCILWICQYRGSGRKLKYLFISHYAGFGPILGILLFLILFRLMPGSHPMKKVQIHPISVISPYIRQYSMLWFFEPFHNDGMRRLMFWNWTWLMTILVGIAGATGIFSIVVSIRRKLFRAHQKVYITSFGIFSFCACVVRQFTQLRVDFP